jgi:hypothetical protein
MATCRGDHVTTSGFHEATSLRLGLQWLDKGSHYIALSAIVRSVSGRDGVSPVRGNPRSAPFLVAPGAEAKRGRGPEAHKAPVNRSALLHLSSMGATILTVERTMRRRDGTLNSGMGTATADLLSASLHFGPTPLLRRCDSCASFRRKRAFLRGGYCCLGATWTTFGHNSVHGTAARTGQQLAGRGESRNFQVNGRNNARNVHGANYNSDAQ